MRYATAFTSLTLLLLAGCVSSEAIRTSANTAVIQASADAECGGVGAARVAQRRAAIETITSGYDRYIITGGQSANNTSLASTPGRYDTSGSASVYGNRGTYQSTTTYTPGIVYETGSHDQSFSITMYRNGEAGAGRAIDARQALGPDWKTIVEKGGPKLCFG